MRSALVASCVSSQSSAWPLVPFTSAADEAPLRSGVVPNTVAWLRPSLSAHVRPQDVAHLLRGPGEHHAQAVDDAPFRDGHGLGRKGRRDARWR